MARRPPARELRGRPLGAREAHRRRDERLTLDRRRERDGPRIEVHGRTLACPSTDEDLNWLRRHATPAPYGRGEETLLDREVRHALQIGAEHVKLKGAAAKRLANEIRQRVAQDMGLDDAQLRLEPLKLLLYEAGGHFAAHADTEKSEGMVASATVVVPGRYEGGTLAIEHAGQMLRFAHGGTQTWRWAAWYADCRHTLEPVRGGTRVSMTVDADRMDHGTTRIGQSNRPLDARTA